MNEPKRKPAPPIVRATCPISSCAQKLDQCNHLEACWDLQKHMKDAHQLNVPLGFAQEHVAPIKEEDGRP